MSSREGRSGRATPDDQAREILMERDIIRKHFEGVAEMKLRLAQYEAKFGIPSNEVHNAIDYGNLHETDEVCDWLLTFEALERSNAIATGR